jgi:hypothetical protein
MPSKMPALRRGSALARAEKKEFGPVQIVVVGFDDLKFEGDILPELRRLRDLEIVGLLDMVIVAKSDSEDLVQVHASDLTQKEAAQSGAIAELSLGSKKPRTRGSNPRRAPAPRPATSAGTSVTSALGRLPT